MTVAKGRSERRIKGEHVRREKRNVKFVADRENRESECLFHIIYLVTKSYSF